MAQGNAVVRPRWWGLVQRNRENPTQRKWTFNQRYFAQIDTPEKAYWLGFIAGDGCIGDGALHVGLAVKDEAHLHALRSALDGDHPIRRYLHRVDGKEHLESKLTLHSWRMVEDLAQQGIAPGKTTDLLPWDGPPSLMPHYWRGLVDADGTISLGPPDWELSLIGTKPVVTAFGSWARDIEPLITAQVHKHKSIWKFAIGGRCLAQSVASALYGDGLVALSRKAVSAATLITSGPRREGELGVIAIGADGTRHGTSGYRQGCRCPDCRAAHAAGAAKYAAADRAKHPRACPDCGVDITHRHRNAKRCEACVARATRRPVTTWQRNIP